MYCIVEKTKRKLEKISNKEEQISAEEIMQVFKDALDSIVILENECEKLYYEGKIDGLEWMASTMMQGRSDE